MPGVSKIFSKGLLSTVLTIGAPGYLPQTVGGIPGICQIFYKGVLSAWQGTRYQRVSPNNVATTRFGHAKKRRVHVHTNTNTATTNNKHNKNTPTTTHTNNNGCAIQLFRNTKQRKNTKTQNTSGFSGLGRIQTQACQRRAPGSSDFRPLPTYATQIFCAQLPIPSRENSASNFLFTFIFSSNLFTRRNTPPDENADEHNKPESTNLSQSGLEAFTRRYY